MNLNFIELLTILQLITIRNSSDGNNIKPQAIKRLVKQNKLGFYTRLSKVQLLILSLALERTKNITLRPFAKKGCALCSKGSKARTRLEAVRVWACMNVGFT